MDKKWLNNVIEFFEEAAEKHNLDITVKLEILFLGKEGQAFVLKGKTTAIEKEGKKIDEFF